MPLQGFLNAFIYLKPFYSRFRDANPDQSMSFVLYQALCNSRTPKKYRPRVANGVTMGVAITDVTLSPTPTPTPDSVNPNQELFDPGSSLFSNEDGGDAIEKSDFLTSTMMTCRKNEEQTPKVVTN